MSELAVKLYPSAPVLAVALPEDVCPKCGSRVGVRPEQPDWRICPRCGPVWMRFNDLWVRLDLGPGARQRVNSLVCEVIQ